jgi:hypothetical protein
MIDPTTDRLIAHVAQITLDDGAVRFYWVVSNSIEPPDMDNLPEMAKHGPFKSVEAALADCDRALSMMGRVRSRQR